MKSKTRPPSTISPAHHPFQPRRLLILTLIFALTLISTPVYSQDSPITVNVNSTDVSTDEVVVLTVTIVADSPEQPRPILPDLDGLAVVDLDLATDVRMINNTIQTEVTYTYLLQPMRIGDLAIPPIKVELAGQIYEAPSIALKARQGAVPAPAPGNAVPAPANPSPPPDLDGQDFFVETTVSTTTPYVSEQLIHTFRIYQAIQLYREPRYDPASFIEFDTRGLPVQQYNMEIGGRSYLITEIRTALFPKRAGNINLGPESLMLVGNIYEDPIELYAEPIELQAQTLPDNAPDGFNGAIGQFQVKAWFDPLLAAVGQPTTLYYSISGTGNIERLPEPDWPFVSGWRGFQAFASFNTELNADQLSGTKVFERLMAPDMAGDFELPSVPFVYFDPDAHEYRTVSTEPIEVKVVAAATPLPNAAPLPDQAAQPVATDVAGMDDTAPSPTRDALTLPDFDELTTGPMPWLLVGGLCTILPTLAVVGVGGFWWWSRRREQRQLPSPALARQQPLQSASPATKPTPDKPVLSQRLRKKAQAVGQRLQRPQPVTPPPTTGQMHPELAASLRRNDDNYRAAGQALDHYLSRVLGESVNGLTRSQLADRLHHHGLDETWINRITEFQARCEMGRYSQPPSPDAGWQIMAGADQLLFGLDQLLGSDEKETG